MSASKTKSSIFKCMREKENYIYGRGGGDKKKPDEFNAPKVMALIKKIKELDSQDERDYGTKFKHFIYSEMKYSAGITVIVDALEMNGFECILKKQGGRMELVTHPIAKQNAFGVLFKQTFKGVKDGISEKVKKDMLDAFNDRSNNHGDKIRIILLEKEFKEGIDLFDVKYAHILEETMTNADLTQIIGRGTRQCGQKALEFIPMVGWTLNVFRYILTIPDNLKDKYSSSLVKRNELSSSNLFDVRTLKDLYSNFATLDSDEINVINQLNTLGPYLGLDHYLTKPLHQNFDYTKDPFYLLDDVTVSRSDISNVTDKKYAYYKSEMERREEERLLAEEKRKEEERIRAEERRLAEEKRREEERIRAEEQRQREEERRIAEEQRREQERIQREEQRIMDEHRKGVELLLAKEARLEEQRIKALEEERQRRIALEEEERRIAKLAEEKRISDAEEENRLRILQERERQLEEERQQAEQRQRDEERRIEKERQEAEERERLEIERIEQQKVRAEEERLEQERILEENRRREEERQEDERRRLEDERRIEEERQQYEQQRLREEQERIEQKRIDDENRRRDEEEQQRLQEERRLQEEQRQLEQRLREEENRRQEEEQRRLEEAERIREEKDKREKQRLREEEERRRIEEEERQQEEKRRLEEEQQRIEEEKRRLEEEQQRIEEEEQQRKKQKPKRNAEEERERKLKKLERSGIVQRNIIDPNARALRPRADGGTFETQQDLHKFIYSTYGNWSWTKKFEDDCISKEDATLNVTQKFLKHYFTPQLPEKGMLLWHSVGSGKTCTGIAVASSEFEEQGYNIIWVTRGQLRSGINKNIFEDVVCHQRVKKGSKTYKDKTLDTKYWNKPITHRQFSNICKSEATNSSSLNVKLRENGRKHNGDFLYKTLVIIDEAHFLYGKTGALPQEMPETQYIEKAINNSYRKSGENSVKVLLMTATPITEKPDELMKLINLCKTPEEKMDISNVMDAIKSMGWREFINRNLTGYISYVNRMYDPSQFAQVVIQDIPVEMTTYDNKSNKNNQEYAIMKSCFNVKEKDIRPTSSPRPISRYATPRIATPRSPKITTPRPQSTPKMVSSPKLQTPRATTPKYEMDEATKRKLRFFIKVKDNAPELYDEFYQILKLSAMKDNVMDKYDIAKLQTLFKHKYSLLLEFNNYLPANKQIPVDPTMSADGNDDSSIINRVRNIHHSRKHKTTSLAKPLENFIKHLT